MSKKKLLICIAFIFVLTLIISANVYAADEPDYLCFTALEDAKISMEKYDEWEDDGITPPDVHVEYSFDRIKWEDLAINTSEQFASPVKLSAGGSIYFRADPDYNKGTNGAFAAGDEKKFSLWYNRNSFKIDGKVSLSGNVMSLLDAKNFESISEVPEFAFTHLFMSLDDTIPHIVSIENLRLPATTLGKYCYAGMFYNCCGLSSVPENFLPATTLPEGCYMCMFWTCSALKSIPEKLLPATRLAKNCYYQMFAYCGLENVPQKLLSATMLSESCYGEMFRNCVALQTVPTLLLRATVLADSCYSGMFTQSGLTVAPELPARNLAFACYASMFSGCENLTTAPELPAMELADSCYVGMFNGCSNLSEVTAYFTAWDTTENEYGQIDTSYWLEGVAENGTFKCLPELETEFEERTGSNIPENWTIEKTLEPLPPEIDFPWWFIPFIWGGTGSGSSSSSEPKTPVTPVIPTASYDKCTKASDCPMYVYYDLDTTKWYHDGIHFCLDNGLMNGVGSYTFDPDGTTTRPMMVTILSRMDGCDTEGGASWDEVGKAWAKTYGISDGIPEEGNITREEFATMLYRYAQKEGKGFTGAWMFFLDFKDADKVSSWANEAVHWCVMKGILQGRTGLYEGMLDPQATLTRAEASAMIQRFCEVK